MKTQLINNAGLVAVKHDGIARIHCERGHLWLSVDGKDITLEPGEHLDITCTGLLLIEGDHGSRYSVATLPARASKRRWPFHSSPRPTSDNFAGAATET